MWERAVQCLATLDCLMSLAYYRYVLLHFTFYINFTFFHTTCFGGKNLLGLQSCMLFLQVVYLFHSAAVVAGLPFQWRILYLCLACNDARCVPLLCLPLFFFLYLPWQLRTGVKNITQDFALNKLFIKLIFLLFYYKEEKNCFNMVFHNCL